MSNQQPCTDAHIGADGLLASRCWCEAMKVRVTPADVRAGRTLSCGADGIRLDWRPPPPPPRRTLWAILDGPLPKRKRAR